MVFLLDAIENDNKGLQDAMYWEGQGGGYPFRQTKISGFRNQRKLLGFTNENGLGTDSFVDLAPGLLTFPVGQTEEADT